MKQRIDTLHKEECTGLQKLDIELGAFATDSFGDDMPVGFLTGLASRSTEGWEYLRGGMSCKIGMRAEL